MIREWADEQTQDRIEDALTPPIEYIAATWDDEEAWSTFEAALREER